MPLMVVWHPIGTYPGGKALFWCVDTSGGYPAFGEIAECPDDKRPRVWGEEGRGFAPLEDVTHWAECAPPVAPHLH